MKAAELKDKLDMYISHGHGDDDVMIHCKESSMGPVAAEPVSMISAGFDWDMGRLLIEPEKPLMHYSRDRDKPMQAVRIHYPEYRGKTTDPSLHCPICEEELLRKDKYCRRCGQRVDTDNYREVNL